MAITIQEADNALKTYYLDAIAEQLNTGVNPLLAAVKQSTSDVWGKEVKKLVACGVNGGIGAGEETGNLPTSGGGRYKQFKLGLKNLYGTIELSDKAIRASANNAGAFVNLLTAEMDSLLKSSSFNFGRMLFGDGNGTLGVVKNVTGGAIELDSVKYIVEGMVVDFLDEDGEVLSPGTQRRVVSVNREAKTFTIYGATPTVNSIPVGSIVAVQGSYGNELTGLKAIFGSGTELYGLPRKNNSFLSPYTKAITGELTELDIQTAIDSIEEVSGSKVNFIVCSWGVRRALQKLFAANNRNIETAVLAGGYKAMSYNGIPIVADRFCEDGCMYLLNTDDFTLHQLCDWQWLESEDGSVLRQVPGKAVYTATLVKYADLLCERPCGQGLITGIQEI